MSTYKSRLFPAQYAIVPLLFATLYTPRAKADDTSVGVVLPGLRSDPAGSVTASASSLVLRPGQVQVTLTVNVQRVQGGSVTIEMPRFGWLGESEPYPARQFPELQILDGGSLAKIEDSFAAFAGSSDVTEAIRSAGVDPFVIADTPPFVTAGAGGKPGLEMLERLGAVEEAAGNYIAKWTAQRKVKIALSPGRGTLTLTYKARPGYALLRLDQISKPGYLAKYCLFSDDLVRVLGHPAATGMFVVSDYTIPVSIDDRRPSSVAVALEPSGKEHESASLIAFCGADGKPVIGQATPIKAAGRTDARGRIDFLSIAQPNGVR